VYRIILCQLSCVDGGLKALLNLRETCSTTKGWIDNLQEKEATRLFSRGQACLSMEEEEDIALFLDTPPPHYIKSLRLIMSNGQPKQGPMVEHRNDDIWSKFIKFWESQSRRLKFLQICGRSSIVMQSRLIKFIKETQVKCIQFTNDSYYSAFHNQDRILMQLETLLLHGKITPPLSPLMDHLVSLNALPLKKLLVPLLKVERHRFSS